MNEAYLSSLFAQLGERPADVHVVRATPPPNLGLPTTYWEANPSEAVGSNGDESGAHGKARAKAAKEGGNPGQHRYYAYVRLRDERAASELLHDFPDGVPVLFPHRFNVKKGTKPGAVWVGELDKPWTCEAFVRELFEDEDVMSVHLPVDPDGNGRPFGFVSLMGSVQEGSDAAAARVVRTYKDAPLGKGRLHPILAVPREERVQLPSIAHLSVAAPAAAAAPTAAAAERGGGGGEGAGGGVGGGGARVGPPRWRRRRLGRTPPTSVATAPPTSVTHQCRRRRRRRRRRRPPSPPPPARRRQGAAAADAGSDAAARSGPRPRSRRMPRRPDVSRRRHGGRGGGGARGGGR